MLCLLEPPQPSLLTSRGWTLQGPLRVADEGALPVPAHTLCLHPQMPLALLNQEVVYDFRRRRAHPLPRPGHDARGDGDPGGLQWHPRLPVLYGPLGRHALAVLLLTPEGMRLLWATQDPAWRAVAWPTWDGLLLFRVVRLGRGERATAAFVLYPGHRGAFRLRPVPWFRERTPELDPHWAHPVRALMLFRAPRVLWYPQEGRTVPLLAPDGETLRPPPVGPTWFPTAPLLTRYDPQTPRLWSFTLDGRPATRWNLPSDPVHLVLHPRLPLAAAFFPRHDVVRFWFPRSGRTAALPHACPASAFRWHPTLPLALAHPTDRAARSRPERVLYDPARGRLWRAPAPPPVRDEPWWVVWHDQLPLVLVAHMRRVDVWSPFLDTDTPFLLPAGEEPRGCFWSADGREVLVLTHRGRACRLDVTSGEGTILRGFLPPTTSLAPEVTPHSRGWLVWYRSGRRFVWLGDG